MSSKFLTTIAIAAICTGFPACSSVSDSLPVVKIERKKPKTIKVQDANYTASASHSVSQGAQDDQAAIACQNEKMRVRAADDNADNDTARMLILDDNDDNSSNVIGEVLVNCRDYFARNATSLVPANFNAATPSSSHNLTKANTQTHAIPSRKPSIISPVVTQQHVRPTQSSGLFYSVRRGDTLYAIARKHCTSVKAIKRLNNIGDPKTLDVNDVLQMPVGDCN